jgi:hypothetical protein
LTLIGACRPLLSAVIFLVYLALMTGLGVFIYRTGHPRSDDPPDSDGDDRLPTLATG